MNERLQAAIDAVEASNPTPAADTAVADESSNAIQPAEEQGTTAATEDVADEGAATDVSEESAASNGQDAPAQRQNKGVGKRINELTREKHEALRRAEAAEARAKALEERQGQGNRNQEEEPAQNGGKPTMAEHGWDPEAYMEALLQWQQSNAQKAQESQQRQQAVTERQQKFGARLSAYESENPGKWELATRAPINYTEPMLEVVQNSEVGPQIAVYLAENLDRADEISRMSPYAAAAALGHIEAIMGAAKTATPPRPPKTVTQAPPPPSQVGGGAVVRKDLASMDVSDHLEAVRAKRNR